MKELLCEHALCCPARLSCTHEEHSTSHVAFLARQASHWHWPCPTIVQGCDALSHCRDAWSEVNRRQSRRTGEAATSCYLLSSFVLCLFLSSCSSSFIASGLADSDPFRFPLLPSPLFHVLDISLFLTLSDACCITTTTTAAATKSIDYILSTGVLLCLNVRNKRSASAISESQYYGGAEHVPERQNICMVLTWLRRRARGSCLFCSRSKCCPSRNHTHAHPSAVKPQGRNR